MVPISFDQANHIIDKPKDISVEQCDPLNVCMCQSEDGVPLIVSCWKITKEELEEFNRTGRIWLITVGDKHSMVTLTANNPFNKDLDYSLPEPNQN